MSKNIQILYVEDDSTLAFVTKDNLEELGYTVTHYTNGAEAINNFVHSDFNLCILDIMLPKMDGYELAERIRKINKDIPIIFLSAKSQVEDRIKGLSLGADDYIIKPFSIEELQLKIEVFLKRNRVIELTAELSLIKAGNTMLDYHNLNLLFGNEIHKLTQREAKLLNMFFENPQKLIPRNELLLTVWGDDSYFNGRSLDVFMTRIRKYLKKDNSLTIENIRSAGYRLIIKN